MVHPKKPAVFDAADPSTYYYVKEGSGLLATLCQYCLEIFPTASAKADHFESHTAGSDGQFHCVIDNCEHTTKFRKYIIRHVLRAHVAPECKDMFHCNACTFSSCQHCNVQKHVNTMHVGVKLLCRRCGFRFYEECLRDAHERESNCRRPAKRKLHVGDSEYESEEKDVVPRRASVRGKKLPAVISPRGSEPADPASLEFRPLGTRAALRDLDRRSSQRPKLARTASEDGMFDGQDIVKSQKNGIVGDATEKTMGSRVKITEVVSGRHADRFFGKEDSGDTNVAVKAETEPDNVSDTSRNDFEEDLVPTDRGIERPDLPGQEDVSVLKLKLALQAKRIRELEASVSSLRKNGQMEMKPSDAGGQSSTETGGNGIQELATFVLKTSLPAIAKVIDGAAELPSGMQTGLFDLNFKLGLEVTQRTGNRK